MPSTFPFRRTVDPRNLWCKVPDSHRQSSPAQRVSGTSYCPSMMNPREVLHAYPYISSKRTSPPSWRETLKRSTHWPDTKGNRSHPPVWDSVLRFPFQGFRASRQGTPGNPWCVRWGDIYPLLSTYLWEMGIQPASFLRANSRYDSHESLHNTSYSEKTQNNPSMISHTGMAGNGWKWLKSHKGEEKEKSLLLFFFQNSTDHRSAKDLKPQPATADVCQCQCQSEFDVQQLSFIFRQRHRDIDTIIRCPDMQIIFLFCLSTKQLHPNVVHRWSGIASN